MDAIYKKAVGFEYEETQTIIEETKTGNKKRITGYKKHSLPDVVAIKYLLVIHFGNEFNEKKAELELMARRLEKDEEVWNNENSDETNIKTPRVRKQSMK